MLAALLLSLSLLGNPEGANPPELWVEAELPPFHADCMWEEVLTPEARLGLDRLWAEAQAAEKRVKKPRPRFCFAPRPIPTIIPGLGPGLLFGYYSIVRNDALIAVDPNDEVVFRCTIVHEMFHAIRGSGHAEKHKSFPGYMVKMGCGE